MRYSALLFLFLLMGSMAQGQQDPLFSQYMFNAMVINPAATGHREVLQLTGSNRIQWAGLEGSPTTYSFSAQSPVTRAAGIGLLVMNDRIGQRQTNNLQLSAAYRVKLGPGRLSFGLRGGGYLIQTNWQKLDARDASDATLMNGNENHSGMNADAGLFYATENFYSGLSVNHIVRPGFDPGVQYLNRHIFLTAGKSFNLSDKVIFQPSVLLKQVEGAPLNGDLNINFRLADIFWTGVSLRSSKTAVLLAAFDLSESVRIGYSHDLNLSSTRKQLSGTHEIYLGINFKVLKGKTVNPRYL